MIEMTFDKKDLAALKSKLDKISLNKQGNVLKTAFTDATLEIESELKENISGRFLHVRTGALRNSIGSKVFEYTGELLGLIGSGVRTGQRMVYATILERGGIIRPKNAKYLAIPIRAGSPEAIRFGLWQNQRTGMTKKPISYSSRILMYIYAKSAKIPAFRYMQKTVDEVTDKVMDIMQNSVQHALEGNA